MTSSGDFTDPGAPVPSPEPDPGLAAQEPPLTPSAPGLEASEASQTSDAPAPEPVEPAAHDVAPIPETTTPRPPIAAADPEPEPEAIAAAPIPAIEAPTAASPADPLLAEIIEIPPRSGSEDAAASEGGEWELLLSQLRDWLQTLRLQEKIQELRRPLTLAAWLIGLVVVLRVYAAVIGTLDRLPLLPGLLELVGVIAVVRFAAANLVRSEQRQALLQQLGDRWKAFRG